MFSLQASNKPGEDSLVFSTESHDAILIYFQKFEQLAKLEQWKEIVALGERALQYAKVTNRLQDEAKICAQLTSTSFYQGNFDQACLYASRCHELSQSFTDPSLFLRALYLESAVYRALAGKEVQEDSQKNLYAKAVEISEEAASLFSQYRLQEENLKGKIYFNLGAAHADNPKGDLEEAMNGYLIALDCFQKVKANEDIIRTNIRLGKVYLLQKNYQATRQIIKEMRPQLSNERLRMHLDYLEAQLNFALRETEEAIKIAQEGLALAEKLGAHEDQLRLTVLLQDMRQSINFSKASLGGTILANQTANTSSYEIQSKPITSFFLASVVIILIGYLAARILLPRDEGEKK